MNNAALQTRFQEIAVEAVFPHAPDTIWKTLTSGALMARWLGMSPEGFEAVVGNRFNYRTTPAGKWDGTIECEILDMIPSELLAYSWKGGHDGNAGYGSRLDTLVTFTLEKVEGGTRLRLVHSGFALPKNDMAYRKMSGGWSQVVPRIGALTRENVQNG